VQVTAHGLGLVRLIAFPGAPNLPIFVAQELGLFREAGIEVELETTPSSSVQIQRLVAGEFEMAATAFDNVVAYEEGQGGVTLPAPPDLFVFMGATQVELSFVVAPNVESYADLRGRPLALDALATGFAFVLYHMLERAGLAAADRRLVAVGATPQRWEALRAGEAAGTLMIEPFTSVALAQGFRVLETSRDCLPRYQGGIFASRRAWAAEHGDVLRGFIRAYLDGLAWTLNPANRDAASALLLRCMPAIKPGVVDAVMRKLLAPETGLTPAGAIDLEGMRAVLALRSRYAEPRRALTSADAYLDLRAYESVLREHRPVNAS
jgi:ABC-type nitrate/sulfonate/bicarbonate transport system substrate-binding protein